MKNLMLVALLATAAAQAQDAPEADVGIEYAHLQILKGFTIPMDGASGSVAFNPGHWLGLTADVGVYHGSPGESLTGLSYAFGPRFTYRKLGRLEPFAEALIGGLHFSTSFGGAPGTVGSHFAFAYGGGGDIVLGKSRRFALRGEGEYFGMPLNGSLINNIRLSGGIVYRVGRT